MEAGNEVNSHKQFQSNTQYNNETHLIKIAQDQENREIRIKKRNSEVSNHLVETKNEILKTINEMKGKYSERIHAIN
jgi:hypothetical protein